MTDPTQHHGVSGLDVAIIGMAGRFPSADNVDALWENLCNGVEAVTRYDDDALAALHVPHELIADPDYVKAGVRLDGVDRFDAAFFGYTPRDAERIDPQHRIFLECAWHALEHAGYDPYRYNGLVGVYAGSGANVYLMRNLLRGGDLEQGTGVAELLGLMSGNMPDALATRVAYKLNLRGPAVTVQTACSTSLMAVHTACQALLGHECDMALAGGVSLNLLQNGGYRYQAGAIFSPDGHCRAFDAKAAGTLQGSGAALVVLKRLADAVRDGDIIHAVIKGSAANNDGSEKVGFTAPSVNGQAAVIRAAQEVADVSADSIGYVEAHGTGTTLGDPIEVAALTQAFRASTARTQYCAIGSVKTNIGHLDAAAGVTGLIKATLALKRRTLPPSLNYETPNPQIDFANSPFYVNTVCKPWETDGAVRRAGVSSFGIGGTNVHVILEEAPPHMAADIAAAQPPATALHLLPVSARTGSALKAVMQNLGDALERAHDVTLHDVAHTLRAGRRHMPHRAAVLARSTAAAADALLYRDAATIVEGQILSERPSVAFLFPGQGAQHVGMGKALYDSEPVFRDCIDRCSALLRPHLALDLRDLLFPTADQAVAAAERLAQTAMTQPALFVVEYAMAQWWQHQGIQPDAMLGHSIGEYTAACVAGVFTLEDGLSIVAARGRLLQSMPPGAMLAISLPEKELRAHRYAGCDLAAVNADDLCVLSGPADAIERAEQDLLSRGIGARRLHVSHAFHSAMVEPMLARFEALLATVPLRAPAIPFLSNVTGCWITDDQATSPAYWANHVRSTVRFADGLGVLLEKSDRAVLEVGPGDTLTGLARRHAGVAGRPATASQCHPQRAASNGEQPARCLAQLWVAGVDVQALRGKGAGRRVPLPGYPFERERYWVERAANAHGADRHRDVTPTDDVQRWMYAPVWKRERLDPRQVDAPVTETACVLVVGDAQDLVDAVGKALRASGRSVVRVCAGRQFAVMADSSYTVRMEESADIEALLASVESRLGPVSEVCHMWSTDPATVIPDPHASITKGFFSVLAITRALGKGAHRPVVLTLVSTGLEDVIGTELLFEERAMLYGPLKVIPQEYPHIACRLVDVVPPTTRESASRVAQQIVKEMEDGDRTRVVAYRGAHRWVKTYDRVAGKTAVVQRFRKHGVYLITGGLGGMGLAFATYLAQHWQARLVLLARSSLRAPSTAVADLERLGAKVLVIQADVADEAQLRDALKSIERDVGPLNGVVHAAGIAGGGLIASSTPAQADKVFAAKVRGTKKLLSLLADKPVDFIVLCSSLAGVAGGIGKVDYAAANAYMDAAAMRAQRDDRRVISIAWDGWRGVGMAARTDMPEGAGIDPSSGVLAFTHIVNGMGAPQIVVCPDDLNARLNMDVTAMLEFAQSSVPASRALSSRSRPELDVVFVEPCGELETGLASIWTDLTGVSPVGVHDSLFDLGGDSLLAIRVLAKVRAEYGIAIDPTEFFKDPTISELAAVVESRLIDEIELECDASSAEGSANE
ncbi:type I polyketide synthase [Pigmentiphaga litoralis]|uniref:Acyl transferase domain-containing protein/acyl carrier protein n=1 Tax=Pigmentiphaga litoralis TaxID=516702 RepID=A0A7Y9IY11_9BURK|nr:type I polyketide synthase [Pigmentiphaga litoralis]NYE25978.1 acyl transferase domain-containing protein/acyl carrier protein [Pigmentiphaga litoralis]NYE85098.1 acyl transferase domain-containing protein/acyl carrier protein [Pigmentiphaga litoralis]